MSRFATLTLLTLWAALPSLATAQAPDWRFHWKPGQVLNYRFEQLTEVTDAVADTKAETSTKLSETKRWQVLSVDPAGIATVQLSLTALRLQTKTVGGDELVFDSADPDKSTSQLREQMQKYINVPLVVLRIDGRGKVVEIKECKYGSASRFESELPFVIALPEHAPQVNQFWERPYQVTLEPPQGTGEKFKAGQKCTVKACDGKTTTLTVACAVKEMPQAVADQVPLLQAQPEGEVVFDIQQGILRSARLSLDKQVTGHQGDGSSYHIKSTSTEEYIP
jgi:hypothetical protein